MTTLAADAPPGTQAETIAEPQLPRAPDRTVVLVGMMGAGKSCIGRRLASRTGMAFIDADTEIEKAAGCTVAEIFARYGAAAFRDGERRVMARLLQEKPAILAAGGGAFIDPDTRALIRTQAISVWLRADLDTLVARTKGRSHRPLLNSGDPRATLADLMDVRYPIYAEADITIDTGVDNPNLTCTRVLAAIEDFTARHGAAS
jgi:shikimate kinase